jgi:predicted ester cyclase
MADLSNEFVAAVCSDGAWFHRTHSTGENHMNTAEKLARDVLSALSEGDIDRVGPLVAEGFVDHGAPPWAPQGRAGYLRILAFLTSVLQLRYELHEVVAEGDLVALRATAHGRHNSGHLGFPPTGKPYAMPVMHMYRQSGGVLTEHWGVRDELAALWQVGALPTPEPVPLTHEAAR